MASLPNLTSLQSAQAHNADASFEGHSDGLFVSWDLLAEGGAGERQVHASVGSTLTLKRWCLVLFIFIFILLFPPQGIRKYIKTMAYLCSSKLDRHLGKLLCRPQYISYICKYVYYVTFAKSYGLGENAKCYISFKGSAASVLFTAAVHNLTPEVRPTLLNHWDSCSSWHICPTGQ